MTRTMVVLVLLALLVLAVGSAQADGLRIEGLSLSAVAAAGAEPGIGGALSYRLLELDNASLFADLGLLVDGERYLGFVGMSTDYALPIVKELPGSSCVGVGWNLADDTWLIYLRSSVASW